LVGLSFDKVAISVRLTGCERMYLNLKLQIFRRGIRQKQLASELGMHESLVSKIINGYREPSEAERKLLATYFDVKEDWLFEWHDTTVHQVEAS